MPDTKIQHKRKKDRFEPGYLLHDRYEVQDTLGAGGFAVIYAAFDQTIERRVAIKVLNIQHMAGSQEETDHILERFLREARVAAKIRHPSIVEIYDFGVLDDGEQPYIIMEFLEGTDLEHLIVDHGPMDAERLFPLFCGALDALGEAHREGVIHKDLKPANLFLSEPDTRKETLKVVDFGIAHVNAPDKKRMTKTGLMSGTPQYLPPEYIESQAVTEEMDIYQMGLILIEALSGEAVVQESSPYQAAFKHMHRDLIIPPELLEGPLGEVIERAIAFEPKDRFDTAEEFSDALAAIDPASVPTIDIQGSPQVAGPPSPVADTDASLENRDGDWSEDALAGTLVGDFDSSDQVDTSDKKPSVNLQGPMAGDDTDESAKQRAEAPSAATQTADPVSAKPSWHKITLISLSLGSAVLLGILVAILVMYDDADPAPPAEEPPAEEAEVAEESEQLLAEALDEDPEELEEEAVEEEEDEEEPELFRVELESTPAGAEVQTGDGESLGNTPLVIERTEDDEPVEVELTHSGYRAKQLTIDNDTGETLAVELERRPQPSRPAPQPEPQPEPEPEPTPALPEPASDEPEEDEGRQLQLAP